VVCYLYCARTNPTANDPATSMHARSRAGATPERTLFAYSAGNGLAAGNSQGGIKIRTRGGRCRRRGVPAGTHRLRPRSKRQQKDVSPRVHAIIKQDSRRSVS
jgi:hypothetical protein